MVHEVTATSNGFFFFRFSTAAAMEEVIEGGSWLFQGQPIVLQKWESGMGLCKLQHTQVPVWIKLRHLPVELWTTEGLSIVVSGIGKPLYTNAIIRTCTRLDFARVCIMLDISSKLPKHVIIMVPKEDGSEMACKVDIEYEWLPPKCNSCLTLGHATKVCPSLKPKKPVASVYVHKADACKPAPVVLRLEPNPEPCSAPPSSEAAGTEEPSPVDVSDKGKAIVIYNAFDVLSGLDSTESFKGPISSPELSCYDLCSNMECAGPEPPGPSGVHPRWNWFTDYTGPASRIWLAWDDDFVDVDVLEVDTQYVHCRVLIRSAHSDVLLTIVYGVNELGGRRALWQSLSNISHAIVDIPWLVGGDFNTILDASEVCGHSGDIKCAAEEFWACLHDTGLISLPMQGEWFTWHNCRTDSRSLWKKLDRILVNDCWLFAWPDSSYASLNARTSDHSQLVLRGNVPFHTHRRYWHGVDTNPILLHLEFCCRLVLMLATKMEQQMLHQWAKVAWMKGGDQCSRVFFRKEVINEFIAYYQTLLGGDRRARMIDLCYLRPWARYLINEDDATQLIRRVNPDEVKQAVFDIAEDKAPGPDRYSSGFFKAAWPVVRKEVTRAILEFFASGRLLKQVNATLLSLIPKVQNPTLVAEFRPISCCNVLYKELFQGYNQQHLPPRCALKVDIRKAYDTVEWDFLSATLKLFGFPTLFISWIEECITSPTFSIIDQDGGFSYHWRCEAQRLFQLGFVDDLLLFSRADVASVHVFKRGLTIFAYLSGLHVSPQKSHLLLSRAASNSRDALLAVLDFQEGVFSLRYLGLPLLASRLTIADCKPLLLKIDSRLNGWEGTMLSFAGRVQLIKSMLIALQVYWAMAFILSKTIIRTIEKKLRSFLWKGSTGTGYAKVSWNQVCRPTEEGGLGIRNLLALNRGLMSKHLWRVISADRKSLWVDWIFHYRLRSKSVWTVSDRTGSWGWRKLLRLRVRLQPFV
ncbi:UNVERIFIED_CONTAM: hypothetical protein Slati_4451300 [Sesamum latifolium]|uniref:Reverse transcriptase domain-containing protein n=1 Tax=Sesamum latifolium TaxID=2727402 RepID=A0AAW2SQM0_9LAMI